MIGWNSADIWEAAASQIPDATFAMQGPRSVGWGDAGRRAEGLASFLLDGRPPDRKVDDSRPRHDAIDQTARGDR